MYSTGRRIRYVVAIGAAAVLALVTSGAALADDAGGTGIPNQCAPPGSPAGEYVAHIGVSGKAVDGVQVAGAVELRSPAGPRQLLTAPDPQDYEWFGSAIYDVTMSRDSGERERYLLVGAPGRTVDGKADAGGVHVFRCTTGELEHLDVITQADPDVPGEAQQYARFGASLAAYAEPREGAPSHLLIGTPGLRVDGKPAAGGVIQLSASLGSGPDVDDWTIDATTHTLATPGTPGEPEPQSRLGETLASYADEWIAGAPGAKVDGERGAGLVLRGWAVPDSAGTYQVLHQGVHGISGTPEYNDGFGSAIDLGFILVIGSPGEDLEGNDHIQHAGIVHELWSNGEDPHDWHGNRAYSQNSPDDGTGKPVRGVAEVGDRFGAAVAVNMVPEARILVGTPGEQIRGFENAGMVNGLRGAPSWSRDDTSGVPATDEHFGESLYADDNQTLLIGIAGSRSYAGAVFYGTGPQAQIEWEPWRLPAEDNPQPLDFYGGSFGRDASS